MEKQSIIQVIAKWEKTSQQLAGVIERQQEAIESYEKLSKEYQKSWSKSYKMIKQTQKVNKRVKLVIDSMIYDIKESLNLK